MRKPSSSGHTIESPCDKKEHGRWLQTVTPRSRTLIPERPPVRGPIPVSPRISPASTHADDLAGSEAEILPASVSGLIRRSLKTNQRPQVQILFSADRRHWVFGDLFIEQVSGPVAGPTEEVRVGESVFRIVTKEVALRDRVVGFKQWEYTAYGEQALDMLAAFGDEIEEGWLFDELQREDSLDALEALREMARSNEPVTDEILRRLLGRLRGRGQTW